MLSYKDYVVTSLMESSLSRLYSKYKQFDSGTISAFRGENTKEENMNRHRELRQLLVGGGYSVTEIDGVYVENYKTPDAREVKEKSMIIFDHNNKGNLKAVLMKFGERYDQDSITYSSVKDGKYYLIGTSKRSNSYPGYHKEVLLGNSMFGEDGEFHSKINGRPFVFKEKATVNEEENIVDDYITKHHPFTSFKPLAEQFNKIMNE